MAGIKITLDTRTIGKLSATVEKTAAMSIDALRTDVVNAQVMPYDLGDMQNNNTFTAVEKDGDQINARLITTSGSPQARRLYYHPEYDFQKVNNLNAGGEWLKPWIEGDRSDFARDAFAQFLKKEGGL